MSATAIVGQRVVMGMVGSLIGDGTPYAMTNPAILAIATVPACIVETETGTLGSIDAGVAPNKDGAFSSVKKRPLMSPELT